MMRAAAESGAALLFVALATANGGASANPAAERTVSARFLPIKDDAHRAHFLTRLHVMFEPTTVRTAASIEEAAREKCGFSDASYFKRVVQLSGAQPADVKLWTLPACPHWTFNVPTSVPPSATTASFNAKVHLLLGYAYQNRTKLKVDKTNPGASVSELAKTGKSITLPYVTKPVAYVVRDSIPLTPREAVRRIELEFPEAVIVEAGSNESVNSGGAESFELIGPADAEGSGCAMPAAAPRSIAAAALKELVEKNARPGTSPSKVKILVIDTGVDEVRLAPFLAINDGETGPNAGPMRDDDGDLFQDNVFGVTASTGRGPPVPLSGYDLRSHGTAVAALAVGGLRDASVDEYLRERIGLEAVQVVSRTVSEGGVPQHQITGADLAVGFHYAQGTAKRPPPAVINLSIQGGPRTYKDLLNAMIASNALIVAAAGNESIKQGNALMVPFPISFKTNALPQKLLIVGAYDAATPNRRPAAFTNQGRGWVDLLASGCRVDTIGLDGQRERKSGTSFAAPDVAYAAALMYHMGLTKPDRIKARLIAAAEFDEALEPVVFSSGRFDLERALLLAHSILGVRGADGTPSKTVARENQILLADPPCAEGGESTELLNFIGTNPDQSLVKVVGFPEPGGGRRLRFYLLADDGTDAVLSRECTATTGTFMPSLAGPAVRWQDLIEYVPKLW